MGNRESCKALAGVCVDIKKTDGRHWNRPSVFRLVFCGPGVIEFAVRQRFCRSVGHARDFGKQVFFILQNLHYLETGCFYGTRKALVNALSGKDKQVLEAAIALGSGAAFDFDEAFALLYSWCQETLVRTSSIAGAIPVKI